jgi:hypothetical protein
MIHKPELTSGQLLYVSRAPRLSHDLWQRPWRMVHIVVWRTGGQAVSAVCTVCLRTVEQSAMMMQHHSAPLHAQFLLRSPC